MAEKNLIDEIKAAEDQAAASIREAKAAAVRRLNQAQTEAENTVKEARQSAARQFRESIQAAEESAEGRAKALAQAKSGIVSPSLFLVFWVPLSFFLCFTALLEVRWAMP